MAFDLGEFDDMKKHAAFGLAVIELAKESSIIPKRAKRQVVVREKTKVIVRRPRRTKAEIAAADTAASQEG